VKTESLQARETGKPREDRTSKAFAKRNSLDAFCAKRFGVRSILASLLLLISLALSASVHALQK
jgi:hypothetical protein